MLSVAFLSKQRGKGRGSGGPTWHAEEAEGQESRSARTGRTVDVWSYGGGGPGGWHQPATTEAGADRVN
jgi:hypothetical protein